MPKFLMSSFQKYLLIIPFFYTLVSRSHWPRDFIINVVTTWIPGVILIAWQGETSVLYAAIFYAVGYICFICLYEIGYMANDSYGLRNDATPRERVNIVYDKVFTSAFTAMRLIAFVAIAWLSGMAMEPIFWVTSIALALLLTLHNTLHKVELKFLTFLQLSLMRFSLPVIFGLIMLEKTDQIPMIFLIGLLLFTYPRFLTYLEAKDRLSLPERKNISFLLLSHAVAIPLLITISFIEQNGAPLIILSWMVTVQVIYYLVNEFSVFSEMKLWMGLNKSQGSD